MSAQAFYTGDRARRQRNHDEYDGAPYPTRLRTTRWDSEMRHETVAVRGTMRIMAAKFGGTCTKCNGRFAAGTEIEWDSETRKARHLACPAVAEKVAPKAPNADVIADRADALLAEYEAHTAQRMRGVHVAIGRYTVRPADEKVAAVLSIEDVNYGDFAKGTRTVSMHGSFVATGRDGLSESRSWLGIGLIHADGRFALYRPMRELLAMAPATVPAERVHEREKVRVAVKAVKMLQAADVDTLLTYGRTWAAANASCFVCSRPLDTEESQRLGIGPVCLKKVRTLYGAA